MCSIAVVASLDAVVTNVMCLAILRRFIRSQNSLIGFRVLSADDIKIFRVIKSPNDCSRIVYLNRDLQQQLLSIR